jgi:hypothetical protein
MARQKSSKGKGTYAAYKTNNTVYKNKVKKLQRHCKKYPLDGKAKESLERILKEGYKPRAKPLIPKSNQTSPSVETIAKRNGVFYAIPGFLHYPKTAGQQLSELLDIELPKARRQQGTYKPKVTHRKKKNVRS